MLTRAILMTSLFHRPIVTNEEAIRINQQYAGHPGRLVRAWTPSQHRSAAVVGAPPPQQHQFVVTADLHSCQAGWGYDNTTGHITAKGGGCITVPSNTGDLGSTYYDDAALVVQPCHQNDPSQRFVQQGNRLSTTVNGTVLYVVAQPWYTGAGVQLSTTPGRLFFVNGKLQTSPGTLEPNCTQSEGSNHCDLNFASDVCVNTSPTMDSGEALMLWAKPQPGGAVAVFLLNNHPTNPYAGVVFTANEVGVDLGGEVAVRDVWKQQDAGKSANGGRVTVTLPPRDSVLLLLTPAGKN